jgi:hypothetical protein
MVRTTETVAATAMNITRTIPNPSLSSFLEEEVNTALETSTQMQTIDHLKYQIIKRRKRLSSYNKDEL